MDPDHQGLPTAVLGVATWFLLADEPETAFYLSRAEKDLMLLRRNRQAGQTASAQEFHWYDVRKGLLDWKVWAFSLAQFGSDTMLYGFSTFLPTIIRGIGPNYSSAMVQVLTIPCYALGAITYLVVARISDRQQRRGLYTIAFGVVSIVGYALLISDTSSGVHYAGCFLVAMGLYVCVGLPLAWLPANNPRYGKRTCATGLQLTIGNCSGIMSSFLYPSSQGPRFVRGHAVTMAMVTWSILVFAGMWWYFSAENRRRKAGLRDHVVGGMTAEVAAELGDENPTFMYTV